MNEPIGSRPGESIELKEARLFRAIQEAGSLLVAFSGGVDSTFLLAAAQKILGDRVMAATALSETFPAWEKEAAVAFALHRGIRHVLVPSREMELAQFVANTPLRCYHCKKIRMEGLLCLAHKEGMARVAHGENTDDLNDFRPGVQAATELGIMAPLTEAGLSKADIRLLSRKMGLPTWDKPAMACLATRIPYGSSITPEKLQAVQRAEAFLLGEGIRLCRVRHHGDVARIEVPVSELPNLVQDHFRGRLLAHCRSLGFAHVSLDLEGYVTGSMNRVLPR